VSVLSASGEVLDGESVTTISTEPGVVANALTPVSDTPGSYDIPITWTRETTRARFRIMAAGESIETDSIALPVEPVVVSTVVSPPRETMRHRLSLRLEGSASFMLSEYQRNTDPTSTTFQQIAPALSVGYTGMARLGLQLVRPTDGSRGVGFALEAGGGYVRFPTGSATTLSYSAVGIVLLGGGVRLEPISGRWRFFIDAHSYAALTGPYLRVALDAGVGVDIPLGSAVLLGPFVRYTHMIETGDSPIEEDTRFVSVGVGFLLSPSSTRW
jgi:hypothetical protein